MSRASTTHPICVTVRGTSTSGISAVATGVGRSTLLGTSDGSSVTDPGIETLHGSRMSGTAWRSSNGSWSRRDLLPRRFARELRFSLRSSRESWFGSRANVSARNVLGQSKRTTMTTHVRWTFDGCARAITSWFISVAEAV